MNAKEAIEFVKEHNKKKYFYTWERRGFKDVIYLLQQGEKNKAYKLIVGEVKRIIDKNMFPDDKLEIIRENINDLELLYFPELKKKKVIK